MKLQEIFGKYVGLTLKDPMRPGYDEDEVLNSIRETAAQHDLSLQVHWPSSRGNGCENLNRVNLAVKKEGNGRLYIQNKFWIG